MAKANFTYCLLALLLLCSCNSKVQEVLIDKKAPNLYQAKKAKVWPVPLHWLPTKTGQFQKAKFKIGSESQQAVFSIVKLEGDSGTLLANVNRWRRQLSLDALDENDLSQHVDELVLGKKRYYITKQVNEKAILAATHKPSLDITWFFKLEGNKELVRQETQNYLAFLTEVEDL